MSLRREFPSSSSRLGAVALAALLIAAAPLAGCQGLSEMDGSIASIQSWGEKGLAATKVGDCDTFSVPESAVA